MQNANVQNHLIFIMNLEGFIVATRYENRQNDLKNDSCRIDIVRMSTTSKPDAKALKNKGVPLFSPLPPDQGEGRQGSLK